MESRIIKRLGLAVTSEVPAVESDRDFMSSWRALSPVSARAVSLSSSLHEVCYSTLTTVSPVLAVSQSPNDWLRYLGVEIRYEENTLAHNSAQIFIGLDNADGSYALSLE